MAEGALRWVRCRLVAGHGVASGRATTSPYPAGTIHLQAPFFAARGIDLAPFFAGTLNLEAPRGHWCLNDPDARVEAMEWTDRHPPETFSFWHCRLRVAGEPALSVIAGRGAHAGVAGSGGVPSKGEGAGEEDDAHVPHEEMAPASADPAHLAAGLAALIYYPHPETKRAHHQAPSCLEVLARWIPGLHPGMELELGVDPRRCRLIDPVRLRARLLEFLKFRVLAAQEEFFEAFLAAQASPSFQLNAKAGLGPTGDLDPKRLRAWLRSLWPEALDLDDTDLLATLEQARRLYVN
jgi:hypothetical protein